MDFSYKKFALMCLDRSTSPSAVAQSIGLSNAAATGWKNGKRPRDKTIERLAIALDCPVEDLLEDEQKENPAAPKNDGIDKERAEWATAWDNATPAQRAAALAVLKLQVPSDEL